MRFQISHIVTLVFAITLTVPNAALAAENTTRRANSDYEIESVITRDLADAERVSGGDIKVGVDSGLVTLSGTVDSLLDKQFAARIAKRTRGVEAVMNQLIVKRSDRSDDDIRDDVATVLRANDSVAEPRIAVDVSRGEVSITGKVASLAEKRISETAVSGVRGVTAVNNQITVSLSTDRTDQDLQEEINALIVQSVYFDDLDIGVTVEDHVAKISGTVPSAEMKDRLEQVAEVWGVSSVDTSDIKVDPNSTNGSYRKRRYAEVTNATITEALKRSFSADPIVFSRSDAIEADVDSGVVTLTGTVNRLRIKNRAEQLAMDVVGVHRVVNELKVEYSDRKTSDMELIRETQQAIERSAYLERRDIRVHCQRGHVSLYGMVGSELEKRVAEWIADGVAGVVHVNNSLAVESEWKEKSDDQITEDLQRKLKFAFFDKSSRVTFTVENGVAILRGDVDTWRQWQAAMDLAIEAGARHPHNLINVRYHPPHAAPRMFVP